MIRDNSASHNSINLASGPIDICDRPHCAVDEGEATSPLRVPAWGERTIVTCCKSKVRVFVVCSWIVGTV